MTVANLYATLQHYVREGRLTGYAYLQLFNDGSGGLVELVFDAGTPTGTQHNTLVAWDSVEEAFVNIAEYMGEDYNGK